MSKQRRWSEWPKRTGKELNNTAGYAGVGGTAISLAGVSIFSGPVGMTLMAMGAFTAVAAFGLALYRAFPESELDATELVGSIVTLPQLEMLHPRPIALSIVGPSMSGKTTLRHRLTHTAASPTRTQTVTAQIVALPTPPPNQVALLDGGGEKFTQQFNLSANCEYLFLLLDHNASDTNSSVDPARLQQHAEFLQQIRHFLDENKVIAKRSIRILMNKKDLWQRASTEDQLRLKKFQDEELRRWSEGGRSSDIALLAHSNTDPNDVATLVQYLRTCVVDGRRLNV